MKSRSTLDLLSASHSSCIRLTPQYRRTFYSPRVIASSPYRQASRPIQAQHSLRLIRLASSAAATARTSSEPSIKTSVPARSPTSSAPLPQVRAKLNPPDETYPPELSIPERKPSQNRFKYLYQCGKLYIQFYKQGIKNVRSTSKLAKALRQKSAKSTPKQQPSNHSLPTLTRAEWQTVHRSRRDVLRLPAFGALVLIFGEWLPLLALYITPLIPEPCRIPKQIHRKLSKSETRRKERERRLTLDAARLIARDRKPGHPSTPVVAPQAVRVDAVQNLDTYALLSLSTRLDCHSGVWDRLFLTPPKSVLRWGVRRKLEYLRTDDALIERDGGFQGLSKREVERACVERGFGVLGRKEEELRRELAGWFRR